MNISPIIKPTHDDVEAVKAKTDNLPTSPANEATLTAMKQKDTSPAFDPDTDSLEAISEKVAAAGVTTDTGSVTEDWDYGSSKNLQVSSEAGDNVFTTWRTFIAEASEDLWIFRVGVTNLDPTWDAAAFKTVVEVAIGAAESEVRKVRFSTGTLKVTEVGREYTQFIDLPIPIKIPAGSRVSLRVADNAAAVMGYDFFMQFYKGL